MPIRLTENDKLTGDIEAGMHRPLDRSRWSKRVLVNGVLGLLLVTVGLFSLHSRTSSPFGVFAGLLSLFAPVAPVVPPVEVFEIAPPLTVPVSAYNASQLLFEDEELVDGLKAKYKAADVFNFTQGYLTLNFSVGAQPAPVAAPVVELTVAGVPIWRSSTPYARADAAVFSSTSKNVTEYLSLFEENAKVVLSVLEDSTVPVNVSLELVLFNDSTASTKKLVGTPTPVSAYFASEGPASLVVPLQKKVVELPAEEFSVSLPQVGSNVTALKVSLFVSASKEEAEFYKNNIVGLGSPVTANGPVRQLNVFVGDIYVGTVSPKPTLFHPDLLTEDGQQLWSPLADSGSFTGFTYDVDLVGVLPLLWEAPQTLSIALVSPIDTANKVPGVPAVAHPVSAVSNVLAGTWFVSGSLLAWENPLISFASGDIVLTNSSQLDTGVLVAPPAVSPWQPTIKNQIVRSNIKSTIESLFNFTLADNTTASYTVVTNSSAVLVLTKQEKESKIPVGPPGSGSEKKEDTSSSFYIGGSKLKLEVKDPITNLTIYSKSIKSSYPLSIKESTKDDPITGPTSSFSAEFGYDVKTKIDAKAGPSLKVDELVKLDAIVGATTDVKVKISQPGALPFSREVEVVNGTVVKDLALGFWGSEEVEIAEQFLSDF